MAWTIYRYRYPPAEAHCRSLPGAAGYYGGSGIAPEILRSFVNYRVAK